MGVIRENQLTKLFFKTDDNSEQELNCSIKKVYNDRISLNFPKEIENYADYLEEGDDVNVKIFTPAGIKMYDAIILDSPMEGEFTIEFVEDYIKEIQRRKYIRADLNTKVILERGEKGNIVTHTFDIGGGGIRFYCNVPLEKGETIGSRLYLPKEIHSIVARGVILKEANMKPDEYVMMYTKIDERDRDKVIKQCLEIEAEQYKEI